MSIRNYETDDYERDRLDRLIEEALQAAASIKDDFYQSFSFHMISDLLVKAGQFDRADRVADLISEPWIREKAAESARELKLQNITKI